MKQRILHPVPSFARRALRAFGGAVLLAATLPAVQAGPPEAMTFQGFLVDAAGNPLATNTPANYPVIFRIFAAATGGSSLWSEQQIVTVDKGNFSVVLSEGTPVGGEPRPLLSAVMGTNGADRHIQLSVTIDGSTLNMLPRMRLLPSPFAFLSTSANQVVNPAGAVVLSYANSRVEVAGNLFTSGTLSGNGSGLSGLTAGQIPNLDASKITAGTLLDARLSPNVALLGDNNAFLGNQTISGNLGLGTVNTTFPLTIGNNSFGDKISLYGQSGNSYGFGVQSGRLQIHSDNSGGDITFGYGSSAAMTETMRIEGTGNVGIGTNSPSGKLTINGGVRARGGVPGVNGANDNGYGFTGNGGDTDSGMFSSANNQLEFYANNTERMRISGANVTINGSLTVTNTLSLGTLGQDKVASGLETLRMIRGQVKVTGTGGITPEIVSGSGFTVRTNLTYRPPGFGQINSVTELRFTTPFAQPPVVTVTLASPQAAAGDTSINYFSWARVETVSTTNAILSFYHPANGGWLLPSPFTFIAIGPR